ncbi:MAG: hemerythrin [Deltaproteobacteria bacterium]|nr:MAG: hemerythrin [Deltaproteobacteria bacterium]
MTPTEQLKEEHQGIQLMLKILDKICQKMESGEKVDDGHLEKILEFFRVFVDKCHHGKEEDLLFPEMEKAGIPKEGGPIGVLLAEHDQGRGRVREMSEAVIEYQGNQASASLKFTESARNYITLLNQHIEKENNELFPWGERVLSEKQKQELLEGFEKLERERIGEGKHEEFHRLLHHLREVYLK